MLIINKINLSKLITSIKIKGSHHAKYGDNIFNGITMVSE